MARGEEWSKAYARRGHAVVLVLGDVGRSPRMQYHALSLAEEAGMAVTLVGYAGEACFPAVVGEARIREVRIAAFEPRGLPTAVKRLLKVVVLCWRLCWALGWRSRVEARRVDAVVAQTPPAVPTLVVAWLFARWCGALAMFDWHNLGYTLLAEAARAKRGLARDGRLPRGEAAATAAYRWVEKTTGGLGGAHLCVTHAMAEWLEAEFHIRATVFYDRPPRFFGATTGTSRNSRATTPTLAAFAARLPALADFRPGEDALVVSSTSWSPDEDFRILLDALARYDRAGPGLPRLRVLVTGKGELRAHFEAEFRRLALGRVVACCAWLDPADYVAVLRAAHCGVCLHASSSGLDLPMKVVDMFGAGLPVLALDFNALPELVHHDRNGRVFTDASQLADSLAHVFARFDGTTSPALAHLRRNASFDRDWHQNWRATVLPLLPSAP